MSEGKTAQSRPSLYFFFGNLMFNNYALGLAEVYL